MSTTPHQDERLLDALRAEFARHSRELAERVLAALVRGAGDLDENLWGPAPTFDENVAAEVRSQLLLEQVRAQVLDATLSTSDAAARLGVRQQDISRLIDDGELVALEHAGELWLPTWQFHPNTPSGRLEGLAEVIAAYAGGPITLTQWMLRPNPALAGRTPVDALLDRDQSAVAAAAEAHV